MAAPNPYDKVQRIREANTQLKQMKIPSNRAGRVRFNEKVILYSDDYESEVRPRAQSSSASSPSRSSKSGQNKILLVNVPTGFSEDFDESPSDDGDEVNDETGFRWGCDKEPEATPVIDEEEVVSDIKGDEDDDVIYEDTHHFSSEAEQSEIQDLTDDLEIKCSIHNEDKEVETEICSTSPSPPLKEINEVKKSVQISLPSTPVTTPRRTESIKKPNTEIAKKEGKRPKTAPPPKRPCMSGDFIIQNCKLPSYNGFRSEYGLSAQQLQERKKKRLEIAKALKREKEERYLEEKRRQKENDQMFNTWLVKKKKEAALKYTKKRQSSFHFRTLPAPTYHLDKMGILRKKVLGKKEHTCYSLEEFFKHAKPHQQKTYKIYLGLCIE